MEGLVRLPAVLVYGLGLECTVVGSLNETGAFD
jgi:hypothetical protein